MRTAIVGLVAALLAGCSTAAEPDDVAPEAVRTQHERAAAGPQLAGKTIPASAFEAVATQQLMVDPDSSQTRN
jgi:hypothetical protein